MSKGFVISKETKGNSIKPIKPVPEEHDGLALAMLTSVVISDIEVKDASGGWAMFAGLKIPKITFNFVQVVDKGKKPGVYRWELTPVAHEPNSSDNDWWFEQKPQMIKHFIDAYIGEENFTNEYAKLLQLKLKDGEMEAQAVLDAYREFFTNLALVFNGDGDKLPCIYKKDGDQKGNSLNVWLKLLLYFNGNPVNKGNFALPGYPGEGVIELQKDGVKPSIGILIQKGESIIPKDNSATVPNAPVAGGSTAPNTSGTPNFMK